MTVSCICPENNINGIAVNDFNSIAINNINNPGTFDELNSDI